MGVKMERCLEWGPPGHECHGARIVPGSYRHLNNLLDNTGSSGKLFADDAKVYKIIQSYWDRLALQQDLQKMHEWSRRWILSLNEEKCKIMHMVHKSQEQGIPV